MLVDLM